MFGGEQEGKNSTVFGRGVEVGTLPGRRGGRERYQRMTRGRQSQTEKPRTGKKQTSGRLKKRCYGYVRNWSPLVTTRAVTSGESGGEENKERRDVVLIVGSEFKVPEEQMPIDSANLGWTD